METTLLRRFARSHFGALTCTCFCTSQVTARSARLLSALPFRSQRLISSTPQPPPPPTIQGNRFRRPLIALGIETSCDDTCAAIVTSDRKILSEVLRTQHHLHEPMGGIVPKLAHHAHMRHLPEVVQEAIQKAGLGERGGIQKIDLIAVTRGPGLAHSLGVGLNAAKTLAAALNKPLIGVHHMEAHALTARLTTENPGLAKDRSAPPLGDASAHLLGSDPYPLFPFLTLLVSGGHTLLLIAHSVNRYTTLANTVDDSIGEAFDKSARELEIPWLPGRTGGPGASLEAFAKGSQNPTRYLDRLPIPMSLRSSKQEMKFSFAGLKSALARIVLQEKAAGTLDEQRRMDLAAGFQHCAVTHLCQKVEQGLHTCHARGIQISSLVISGGVGRNATLRAKMEELCQKYEDDISKPNKEKMHGSGKSPTIPELQPASSLSSVDRQPVRVICPPPKLCTDNAVMIAWTGLERFKEGLVDPYDIDIVPKWPLDLLGTGIVPE